MDGSRDMWVYSSNFAREASVSWSIRQVYSTRIPGDWRMVDPPYRWCERMMDVHSQYRKLIYTSVEWSWSVRVMGFL
jgi:hypothetical protein